MTDPAPRRRAPLIVLGALLAVLVVLVLGIVQSPKVSSDDARQVVKSYLDHLKAGEYAEADALLCPGLLSTQALQDAYEADIKSNGGSLKSSVISGAKVSRSFDLDWPPTETSVIVTYVLTYKTSTLPLAHHARIRDTSDGLRICAFETHA